MKVSDPGLREACLFLTLIMVLSLFSCLQNGQGQEGIGLQWEASEDVAPLKMN